MTHFISSTSAIVALTLLLSAGALLYAEPHEPPLDAEKTLLDRYIGAHFTGDGPAVEKVLARGELFDRVVAEIPAAKLPPAAAVAKFRAEWLGRPQPVYFPKGVVKNSLTPGGIRVVHREKNAARTRVVIRLLTAKATLPQYQELVLGPAADGKLAVLDYRPIASEPSAAEEIRRELTMAPERARQFEMLKAGESAGKEAVFDAVRKLRLAAQQDEELAMQCVVAVLRHGVAPFHIAILTEYLKHHPNGRGSQLAKLQLAMKTEQFKDIMTAIDGLEPGPNRDPYLDVMRAKINFMKDDVPEAVKLARRALAAEPGLPEVYDCLLKIAIDAKDYAGAVSWLQAAAKACPGIAPDLSRERSIKEFLDSKEFSEWKAGR